MNNDDPIECTFFFVRERCPISPNRLARFDRAQRQLVHPTGLFCVSSAARLIQMNHRAAASYECRMISAEPSCMKFCNASLRSSGTFSLKFHSSFWVPKIAAMIIYFDQN